MTEKMNKHSPGPWKPFIGNDNKTVAVMRSSGRSEIINWIGFDNSDIPYKQHVANVHLVAAAPDMLASLMDLGCVCDAQVIPAVGQHTERCQAVEIAIRKARGKK